MLKGSRKRLQDGQWRPAGIDTFFARVPRTKQGWEIGCKEWCRSVSGWRMGAGVGTRRLKGTDPEKNQIVGRCFKIRRNNSDGA